MRQTSLPALASVLSSLFASIDTLAHESGLTEHTPPPAMYRPIADLVACVGLAGRLGIPVPLNVVWFVRLIDIEALAAIMSFVRNEWDDHTGPLFVAGLDTIFVFGDSHMSMN